ncbi:MAG: glutathione S-transferase family protein [Sphingomonadales bacterium]|nr:glutathione S-transferase family protein [Sphingomonadales bacterium]
MWLIHQFPLCPFSRKVRLLLGEKGVGYELVREHPWERRDEFVDLNPPGGRQSWLRATRTSR